MIFYPSSQNLCDFVFQKNTLNSDCEKMKFKALKINPKFLTFKNQEYIWQQILKV